MAELGSIAQGYATLLGRALKTPAAVCDRERIVAVAGAKKELLGAYIGEAAESALRNRKTEEFRGARPVAGQRLHTVQKQHLRIRCRQHGHLQRLAAQTGRGLRKHLSGPGQAHDGAAPPEILLDDMQRPGEDQPQPVRPLSPPLESAASLVWKKYPAFSKAARTFLSCLRGLL